MPELELILTVIAAGGATITAVPILWRTAKAGRRNTRNWGEEGRRLQKCIYCSHNAARHSDPYHYDLDYFDNNGNGIVANPLECRDCPCRPRRFRRAPLSALHGREMISRDRYNPRSVAGQLKRLKTRLLGRRP